MLKEWVLGLGYLTTSFINRGDPAAVDYTTVNFTADGAWHVLDLSAIVPEGAQGVAVGLKFSHLLISRFASFRRHGNVALGNQTRISTIVANVVNSQDIEFAVDEDRKCDYLLDPGPWLVFDFVVKAWWL